MKRSIALACALLLAGAATAGAACPPAGADGSAAQSGTHQGISKDGTHAPMESATGTTGQGADQSANAGGTGNEAGQQQSGQVSKDGKSMPMNENPDIAMSNQDVAAQQKGDQTAAASAEGCK